MLDSPKFRSHMGSNEGLGVRRVEIQADAIAARVPAKSKQSS